MNHQKGKRWTGGEYVEKPCCHVQVKTLVLVKTKKEGWYKY